MESFSERYGYVKVSDALIIERITPEIKTAIYNCYKLYIYTRQFDGTYSAIQNSALKHLADKENPDYRNSIKESISAVGALCREMTGENDLGKALYALEKKQSKLHPQLKAAFDNLYRYVNEKQSGIRHELMDESGTYVPTYHEAKFMLVTSSAFINYLNGKFGSDK